MGKGLTAASKYLHLITRERSEHLCQLRHPQELIIVHFCDPTCVRVLHCKAIQLLKLAREVSIHVNHRHQD